MKPTTPVDFTFKKTSIDTHIITLKTEVKDALVQKALFTSMNRLDKSLKTPDEVPDGSRFDILPQFYKSLQLAFKKTIRYINRQVEKKYIIVISNEIKDGSFIKDGDKWIIEWFMKFFKFLGQGDKSALLWVYLGYAIIFPFGFLTFLGYLTILSLLFRFVQKRAFKGKPLPYLPVLTTAFILNGFTFLEIFL
jgi:hypothetical protein